MSDPVPINGSECRRKAIHAIADILEKFRIDSAFVGKVAEAAWLGDPFEDGSVDVLAVLSPDRRQQIPMMAMQNRCFRVDKEAVEAAQELDLIPMAFSSDGENVGVHVLIASNALYSIMIRDSVEASIDQQTVRVVRPEDLALLLVVDDSEEAKEKIRKILDRAGDGFDVDGFNERLESIGLGSRRIDR
ncbi:MAG: hypothetical protein R3338_09110 [Thermoanaerobaculia bacterium]|nr:hypothetical protein [Thermoanaerobaculia bacterium]